MTQIIEKSVSDEQYIAKWKSMLAIFKQITDKEPAPEKVKDKLLDLKQAAINTTHLTERQKEAIISRCDNYLSGTYGKDSKKKDYIENKKES